MTRQRFCIDTNLLGYSIDTDDGPRHEHARDLMDALAEADYVLTLPALAGFFRAVTRKSVLSPELTHGTLPGGSPGEG